MEKMKNLDKLVTVDHLIPEPRGSVNTGPDPTFASDPKNSFVEFYPYCYDATLGRGKFNHGLGNT